MSSVPRPLIALLAVVVLFFALWTVALKHTVTGGGQSGSPSSPAYQSAINQARGLQSVVNSAGAASGGRPTQSLGNPRDTTPSAPAATTSASAASRPATTPHTTTHRASPSPAPGTSTIAGAAATSQPVAKIPPTRPAVGPTGPALVRQALQQHKVLALLFYNPAAADDRAVNAEMSLIPTQGGRVVKLTVPVQQLGRYADLLNQVPVNFSPTLVLINRADQAQEIAGFADPFEIAQRVAVALRSAPAKL